MDDDLEDINPSPLTPSTVSDDRITAVLDPTTLILDAPGTKERFNCYHWGKRKAWSHLRPLVSPNIMSAPAMEVGQLGCRVEIHFELPLERARANPARRRLSRGRVLSSMDKGWFLPDHRPHNAPRAWGILNARQDIQGHLAGLYRGHGPAKISVRNRAGLPAPELRAAITQALEGAVQAPAVEVRVRGYGAELGQPANDYATMGPVRNSTLTGMGVGRSHPYPPKPAHAPPTASHRWHRTGGEAGPRRPGGRSGTADGTPSPESNGAAA